MMRLLLMVMCASLGWMQLLAQDELPGEVRSFSFRVYPALRGDYDGLFYNATPGVFEPLEIFMRSRSDAYTVTSDDHLRLFRKVTDPASEAVSYEEVCMVAVAPDLTDVLVILFPYNGEGCFRGMAMDDSRAAFPDEHVCFFNATGMPLVGTVGDERLSVEPGESAVVDVRPFMLKQTTVGFVVLNNNTLERVLHSSVRFYPNNRQMVLLLPPEAAGSTRIRAVTINEASEVLTDL